MNDKNKTLQQLVTTKIDKPHPAPERVRPYNQPSLQDAITLNPGQHIIVDGKRWVLRGRPIISHQPQEPTNNQLTYPETNTRRTKGTQLSTKLPIAAPTDSRSINDDLLNTYFKCYIPPEINESNAESVERVEEIQARIRSR